MKKKSVLIGMIGIFLSVQPIWAQTWGTAKRATWNSGNSISPELATDSNNHIHVVCMDITSGNWEIYYKKSTNGGTTWTTKRLTWIAEDSRYPAIATDSNNHIHVVWQQSKGGNAEIYYMKSTNGGTSWTTKRLTWTSGDSEYPEIAIDSNNHIHVVWGDDTPGNSEVYYKKSTNGGTTWTAKRLTWTAGDSDWPAITIDSSNHIHVVLDVSLPGNSEVYYKKSTDGGETWTTRRLTWTANFGGDADIATDLSNNIHVVWMELKGGGEKIFYKRSTDGGSSWTQKRLTWTSEWCWYPKITTDSNGYIHTVWGRNYDLENTWEIFFKRSTDEGGSWTTHRLTWNSGWSTGPAIAVDTSNQINVVWEDNTPGNYEIYYRKGIQ
jgi:hypothetical protein